MRVLVLGGDGLLGARLVERLLGAHELLLMDADAPAGAAPVWGAPEDPAALAEAAEGAQLVVLDGRGLGARRGWEALGRASRALSALAARRGLAVVAISDARARAEAGGALAALAEMERDLSPTPALTVLCPAPLLGPGAAGPAVDRLVALLRGERPPGRGRFSFVDVRDVEGALVSAVFRPPAGRLELGAPPVSIASFDARASALRGPPPLDAPPTSDDPALGPAEPEVDAAAARAALGFWTRPRARTLRETAAWLQRRVD